MSVSWHSQDLAKDDRGRFWKHGRGWLRLRSGGRQWCDSLRLEWSVPCGHCGWNVTFGGGDSGRDLGITFAVPLICTIYLTVENVFRMYAFGTDMDLGHDREIGFYFSENALWYHVWVGSMASWSRDYPWCRWWRQGSFHFANLLGRETCGLDVLKQGIPVVVPMPEGSYHGTATVERRTWKRPLWFARVRVSTNIVCPKGVPFSGKGENSWDCGDDGLFGWGAEGESVDHAVAHGVELVLGYRRRYGMPSKQAMEKALA